MLGRCYKCGLKPRTEFYPNSSRANGLSSLCKLCSGASSLERYHRLRWEVLSYYSESLQCSLCQEAIYEFLALDHIGGDLVGAGAKDRREIGSGPNLLRWLKNNHYPPGFRVLCHNCNFRVVTKKPWVLEYQRRWYLKVKAAIFEHYGDQQPICACCGEGDPEVLTIDHIDGGGAQHRKVTGSGLGFYRWLQKNNYPPGFRLLCHNCNHGRSQTRTGACPHHQAPGVLIP